jgi:two-component system sensor histidine kinase KdpD
LDPDTRSDFLAEIESEADRLGVLIEDLLDNASWSGGVMRLLQVTATPSALVGASLEHVRQELGARLVEVDVPDDLPTVEVDLRSMQRVLVNLVQNAHKYSPHDARIHISADVHDGMLELRVDDHGRGIPVNERKQIFEPFYRRTSAAESSVPGKGLGLAICRSIVTAHGGEIQAGDLPGGGARFTVALPLKDLSGQASVASQVGRPGGARIRRTPPTREHSPSRSQTHITGTGTHRY